MPRFLRFLLPLLALALGAGLAAATTVIHMDTRALVARSQDIVVGEIGTPRSYWNPEHTRILTDVPVRVTRAIKGGAAETLTLTQVGGEVDGMRYTIDGSPTFTPGEEALLFVWRDAKGVGQVSGLAQGKFDIRRDRATGARILSRPMPGLEFHDVRSLKAAPASGAAPRVTLDDMVREIERVMAEDGR
jgi:hypothetical protein